MKKDQLPVSRKFYNDISLRISAALSAAPASAVEAMRIVDGYMAGDSPESDDKMAMLAFGMIRAEIDRAMSRSQRARERARIRKTTSTDRLPGFGSPAPTDEVTDETPETETDPAPTRHISRRERRAARNLQRRLNKPRWRSLAATTPHPSRSGSQAVTDK